jgi:hypothetical protein
MLLSLSNALYAAEVDLSVQVEAGMIDIRVGDYDSANVDYIREHPDEVAPYLLRYSNEPDPQVIDKLLRIVRNGHSQAAFDVLFAFMEYPKVWIQSKAAHSLWRSYSITDIEMMADPRYADIVIRNCQRQIPDDSQNVMIDVFMLAGCKGNQRVVDYLETQRREYGTLPVLATAIYTVTLSFCVDLVLLRLGVPGAVERVLAALGASPSFAQVEMVLDNLDRFGDDPRLLRVLVTWLDDTRSNSGGLYSSIAYPITIFRVCDYTLERMSDVLNVDLGHTIMEKRALRRNEPRNIVKYWGPYSDDELATARTALTACIETLPPKMLYVAVQPLPAAQ